MRGDWKSINCGNFSLVILHSKLFFFSTRVRERRNHKKVFISLDLERLGIETKSEYERSSIVQHGRVKEEKKSCWMPIEREYALIAHPSFDRELL